MAERAAPPANPAPAKTRPGISAPTAAPPPVPIEPEFMLSLEERALIEEDAAQSAFRAFQAVKNEMPPRPAETERLKQLAIEAAEIHLERRRALEQQPSRQGPPSDAALRHDKVVAAERLLRQARETDRGLAETASDDLVTAIIEARAAKQPLDGLQWDVAQGRSHTTGEMNAAQDLLTGAEVKLMIAAKSTVDAWRHAWARAVLDGPDRENAEVRARAQLLDLANAEKRRLDEEGWLR